MNRTDIDWCDVTWNPVTGCKRDCPYCYAKKIADRFGHGKGDGGEHFLGEPMMTPRTLTREARVDPYPYGFDPTFHRYRLEEPIRAKKSQNIFVCSMSDLLGRHEMDRRCPRCLPRCSPAQLSFPDQVPGAIPIPGPHGPPAAGREFLVWNHRNPPEGTEPRGPAS